MTTANKTKSVISEDIFDAIEKYDIEKVREFINSGVDVNAVCMKGENKGAPPLLMAVFSNSWDSRPIIAELIKAGAKIDHVDDPKLGFTPLHHAANLGILPAAWALLVNGADTSIRDPKAGRTPLHYAGMKGFNEIFNILVLSGGNPTASAKVDKHTPETYAAMKGGLELGELFHIMTLDHEKHKDLFIFFRSIMTGDEKKFDELFSKYAKEKASETGWTPLMVAALAGRKGMAEKLIGAGADVNALHTEKLGALHYAVYFRNPDIVALLIEKGADLNVGDSVGNTPLVEAVMGENFPFVQMLVKGTKVDSKNIYGETALYASAQGSNLEVVKLLLAAGANPKMKTKDGGTVLHSGARTHEPEVVRELLKVGADLHAKMDDGWQPIHVTAEAGNLEICKLMIELGADKHAKTNDGQTVEDIAKEGGFAEIVKFLKKSK